MVIRIIGLILAGVLTGCFRAESVQKTGPAISVAVENEDAPVEHRVDVKCRQWVKIKKERDGMWGCWAEHQKGFICSRVEGHSGNHHAHGGDNCYVIWRQSNEK